MSKSPQKIKKSTAPKASTDSPAIFKRYPNAIYLAALALLLIIFFHEAFFSGKVFGSADNIVSLVYEPYIQHAKELGINTYWNPYVFCGMPTWGSHVPGGEFAPLLPPMLILKAYGVVQSIVNILPVPSSFWDIVNYFLLGLFTYLYCANRKFDRYASFVAALAVVFSLYTLNWIMGGHNTKITVFSLIPAALLLFDKLFEGPQLFSKRSLLYGVLLIIVFHLQFNAAHLQIIFYSVFVYAFYMLFKLYEGEKIQKVIFVSVIALVAAGIAFAMLSQTYLGMWEYKSYSIREAGSGGSDTGAKGGLDYDYATNWSFSPTEVLTFFIPSFVGFGMATYWGGMPFTESPIYLGIVISALACVGVVLRRRDKLVHFLIALGLFALILSFGKELPALYNLFFNHVPFFNNFRIPSMILCIEVLCVGLLGAIGVDEIIKRMKARAPKTVDDGSKPFLRALILTVALFVVVLIGKGMFESTYIETIKSSNPRASQLFSQVENAIAQGQAAQIPAEYINATHEGVFSMAYRDTLVALFFFAAVLAVLWAVMKGKLKLALAQAVLVLLLIIDFWIVDYKPMRMVSKREQQQSVQETDYVRFLKQDKSPFRILPVQLHNDNNWFVAFGIQSVAGYHPAKLKLYDDIRLTMFGGFQFQDAAQVQQINWRFLSMLNTKYVLAPFQVQIPFLKPVFTGEQSLVYENTNVLPRAFFVAQSTVIPDDKAMLAALNREDYFPEKAAYLSAPLKEQPTITADNLAATKVTYTRYEINGFEMEVETPQSALLKVSEVYYPSGWKATIDGAETEIYRTDYCLRAIVVPAGKHKIVFDFEPKTYKTGLYLTTISNYLIGLVLLVYLALFLRKRFLKKQPASA